jgi:ribosomal small subunit protein bTHX
MDGQIKLVEFYQKIIYLCFLKLKKTKMGKGDKKSKKGKITIGSHGNSRPKASKKNQVTPEVKA